MKQLIPLAVLFIVFAFGGSAWYASYSYKPVFKQASVSLVAVDEQERGMLIPLTVEVKAGNGKILVNIDVPSFVFDTQDSMRTAVREAFRITGFSPGDFDAIFSLKTNISSIGGPSAGAAMTLAVIAVLENKRVKENVVITGTISDGGRIGHVGAVVAKAKAAKQAGATLFLVPAGEAVSEEEFENCSQRTLPNGGYYQQCTIDRQSVNVSKSAGIEVREVATISEAVKYMLE